MTKFSLRPMVRAFPTGVVYATALAVALKVAIDISVWTARVLGQRFVASSINVVAELETAGYFSPQGSVNGDHATRMFFFPLALILCSLVIVGWSRFMRRYGSLPIHRIVYRRWKATGLASFAKLLREASKPAKVVFLATLSLQGLLMTVTFYTFARSLLYIHHFYVNGYMTYKVVSPFGELFRFLIFCGFAAFVIIGSMRNPPNPRHLGLQ